jgi:hypothetical protein
MQRSPIRRFLLRFALVYVLLLLPWPGFHAAFNAYFRAFGGMIFAGQTEHSEITFETAKDSHCPNQTRVVIVNNALMNYDGSGPVRNLDFDAHAIGWRPIALLAALIYATPISWGRRTRAFAFGAIGIHAFLIFFLAVGIWSEANELPLAFFVPVTPFWKAVATGVRTVVVAQIGLFIPVLVWILVTFRRAEMIGVFAPHFVPLIPNDRKSLERKG